MQKWRDDLVEISIIVPTYNCDDTIKECLFSLLNQEYQEYEIVVVDDASSDNTFEIAKRLSLNHPEKIKLYRMEQNSGAPCCMNLGIKKARYNLIGIIDGDAVAPKDWLKKAEEKSKYVDVVGGSFVTEPVNDFEKAVYILINFSKKEIIFDETNHRALCLAGTNFFFKKNVFRKLNGFDEDIRAGYDKLFQSKALKNGFTVKYVPDMFVYHPCAKNIQEYVRRLSTFHGWRLLALQKCDIRKNPSENIMPLFLISASFLSILVVLKFGLFTLLFFTILSTTLIFIIKFSTIFLKERTTAKISFITTFLYFLSKFMGIKSILLRRMPKQFWK